MEKPLISIILPTRNRLGTIRRTVDRVLAQTVSDWELIISDNASEEEGKISYLNELALSDPRIKVFYQKENIGIHKNWKFCIENVGGSYYIPVTDDDWWGEDNYLESLLSLHDGKTGSVFPNMDIHHPEVDLVHERVLTEIYRDAGSRYEICRSMTADRRGVIMVGLIDLKVIPKSEIIDVIDNDLASGIEVVGMHRIARNYDAKFCETVSYHHTAYSGNHFNSFQSDQVNQDRGIVCFRLLDDLRKASRADEGFTPAFLIQWNMAVEYCCEMAGHTPRAIGKNVRVKKRQEQNKEKLRALQRQVRSYETAASTPLGALGLWWRLRFQRSSKTQKAGSD